MATNRSGAFNLIPFAHPEALSEPEKLLAAYFSSSSVGLCVLDSEMRYLAIDNTLAAMNGMPAAEHMGKTISEVLGDAAGAIEAEFRRTFSTGEPVTNVEISVKLPARTEAGHWIEHFFPLKDGLGRVQRIAAVVTEITEQKNWNNRSKTSAANCARRWTGCRCC
jgi:PAS domain S-box-containing protein